MIFMEFHPIYSPFYPFIFKWIVEVWYTFRMSNKDPAPCFLKFLTQRYPTYFLVHVQERVMTSSSDKVMTRIF